MNEKSKVRLPKQQRSIKKKEAIRTTALQLFCQDGYHNITTNRIAKEAAMSVGSLYEYYSSKEDILNDILDDYFTLTLNHQYSLTDLFSCPHEGSDKREWLRQILIILISSHRSSLPFNKELQSLYFTVPKVAEICQKQKNIIRVVIYDCLNTIKADLKVTDLEAATVIFMDMLDSIINRVTLYPLNLDEKRIINEGIEAINNYLFL